MKRGLADWRIWVAATWLAMLARCAWGVELPWTWEGRMEFGGERTEWVVDLDGAPERVEVRLEGDGGRFLVDEASWDGAWNGTPLDAFREGTGGEWMATKLDPDAVTRHLRFRAAGGRWVLTGVRVAGGDGETQVVFNREDGFEITAGAEGVCIRARVVNGGGGWFGDDAWECDEGAGHGEGAVFRMDSAAPGAHWARVRAGCDGCDDEPEGTIRWRVLRDGEDAATYALPVPPVARAKDIAGEEAVSPVEMAKPAPRTTVEDYYAGCYDSDGQLLTGANLKKALCEIVNSGTKTYKYGSNLNSILEHTDACPTNPAMVQCIYLQRGITVFNKEHIWAQSHGINGKYPAYSDLHHLRASDYAMNSARGNLDFDVCREAPDAKEKNGCWYTTSAWEPPDSAKGDVARAAMFMAVRYEPGANPVGDLELAEAVGTGPGTNVLGRLSTLLDWNESDPVDEFEQRRNGLIYEYYQGNRNPFIDHPEWARRVFEPERWGGKSGVRVSVTELEARQRYPWNGLVDIDYQVRIEGGRGDEMAWVSVEGVDGETGETVEIRTLEGPGADGPVRAGRHRMTWNFGVDAPERVSDSFKIRMLAGASTAEFWVVDMGEGPDAEIWQVETWEGEPVGGWGDEYKTSKLVLRRLEAASFSMGSPAEETGHREDETIREMTIEEPWMCGVFETTQKQWELATGEQPSRFKGEERPVESVDWGRIRGKATDGGVGEESFLGVLRAKTGLAFDLPTEAQWEYACRAGTKTALNNGKDLTDIEECDNLAGLGRYAHNGGSRDASDGRHAPVGGYAVNAWGLYDMHGNVWEWCRDGVGSGDEHMVRGGSWCDDAQDCRSARRCNRPNGGAAENVGVRVGCPATGGHEQRLAFGEIGAQVVTGCVVLAATASSGGEVSFSLVSGPGVLEGNELHFTGTGEVVVRARQAGNERCWPVNAERCLKVIRAEQELAFGAIGPCEVGERVELAAVATGSGEVRFSVVSGPGKADGTVLSFTGAGVVTVSATQDGDETWTPVSVTQDVRVVESGLLHSVHIADGIEHGVVSTDVERVAEGDTVVVSVVPDAGWKVASVTVNGEPMRGGMFVMPGEDVSVNAVFAPREMVTYWPVKDVDDFDLGASYLLVAQLDGVYASAMDNKVKESCIGAEEVGIEEDGSIRSDLDSIVWRVEKGTEDGYCTIYNGEAGVYAAGPESNGNYAQLLTDGTALLAQWRLEEGAWPETVFRSVRYSNRYLSRNRDAANDYFAAYSSSGVLPRLYKKEGKGPFKARFDRKDGFAVEWGMPDRIGTVVRNGAEPYAYAWTGDLEGNGASGDIPADLEPGPYSVTLRVTDATGAEVELSIGFTVIMKYPVEIGAVEHGMVSRMPSKAAEGETVTLSATAEDGWKFVAFTVDGEPIEGSTFAMPASGVTVGALFAERQGPLYRKISEIDELEEGDYVFTGRGSDGKEYAMSAVIGGTPTYLEAGETPQEIIGGVIAGAEESLVWKLGRNGDRWTIWNHAVGYVAYPGAGISADAAAEAEPSSSWSFAEYNGNFLVDNGGVSGHYLEFQTSGQFACQPSYRQGLGVYRKVGTLPFAVWLDKATGFVLEEGDGGRIVASARNGIGPYRYVWSGDLAGEGDVLEIPQELPTGKYGVTVAATANDGTVAEKSLVFFIVPKYPVVIDGNITNGTVVADVAETRAGGVVTLAFTPDTGYRLESLLLNGEAIGGNSFVMPEGGGHVSATFVELGEDEYHLLESADEIEIGARYLVVAKLSGKFTSAMKGEPDGSRIPTEDIEIPKNNTIKTNAESLVWILGKGTTDGSYTLYNAAGNVFAAAMWDSNSAQLINDGMDKLAQWTLGLGSLPQVGIYSAAYPYRWLARNNDPGYPYYRTYQGTQTPPMLFKQLKRGAFRVTLDKESGFVLAQGSADRIVATTQNGTAPVSFVWTGDLTGNDDVLAIPDTLQAGAYTASVVATDAEGHTDRQRISFTVLPPPERYAVTVETNIHGGTLETEVQDAAAGETVRVTAIPDDGMELEAITVNGEGINGTVFTMPGHAVVISAVFKAPVTFGRIHALSELTPGEYVVTGAQAYGEELAMLAKVEGTARTYLATSETPVMPEGGTLATADGRMVWTLAEEYGYWTLYNEAVGYIGYFGGGNSVGTEQMVSEKSCWTITESGGVMTISNVGTPDRQLLCRPDIKRFSCYTDILPSMRTLNFYKAQSMEAEGGNPYGKGVKGASKGSVAAGWPLPKERAKCAVRKTVHPIKNERNALSAWRIANSRGKRILDSRNEATAVTVSDAGWAGETAAFRVDGRIGSETMLDTREVEWVVWDSSWIEGTSRMEVSLEHPDGTLETLGVAEGKGVRGSVEWVPGTDEWGTFTLRLASWDGDGEPLEELLALRIRQRPVDSAYAAWIASRGGTPETMPMEADADADGASNWEEYVADTDPLDAEETFASRLEVLEDGTLRVIPSVVSTGRVYRAKLLGDLLEDGEWLDLGPGCPGIGAPLGDENAPLGIGAMGVSLP